MDLVMYQTHQKMAYIRLPMSIDYQMDLMLQTQVKGYPENFKMLCRAIMEGYEHYTYRSTFCEFCQQNFFLLFFTHLIR